MPFRDRVAALRRSLSEGTVAALYPGPNARYLAGIYGEPYDRHFLFAVPAAGEPFFVTPRKSLDLIRDESPFDARAVIPENDPGALAEAFCDALDERVETVRLDGLAPHSLAGPLRESDLRVGSAEPLLKSLRRTKDRAELAALERAGAVADEVSEEVRAMDAVGLQESELADEIRGRLHAKGGTRLSFDVVVASGPNAARPYYRSGEREIRAGEPVILDFGAFLDGYAGDQTRTVVFGGDPPEGFEDAHGAVRAAQAAGVEAVEPGATAADVHAAATEVIEARGYGEALVHGTGHGVGVQAHEAPTIGPENDTELEAGMVFSVEPGVYFEGEYGVRVEDLVAVTESGCERLNHSPRTWEPL